MGRKMNVAVKADEVVREVWVDSPLTSWSQFLHELEEGIDNPGRQRAMMNRRTLMGGFCRFHGTEAQEKAAARFKAIYERSQLGGAKAVDPSKEPVDGGGINPESVIEIGADARAAYNRIYSFLERNDFRKVEFVVMGDHGPTAYARWLLRVQNPDGRAIGRVTADFRRIMDGLAVHMGFQNLKSA